MESHGFSVRCSGAFFGDRDPASLEPRSNLGLGLQFGPRETFPRTRAARSTFCLRRPPAGMAPSHYLGIEHPSLRAALGRWQVRSRTNVARRAQRRLRIRHCPDARHFCSGRSTMSPALRPGWRGTAFFPLPSRSDARRGGWVAVAPTDARNAPGDAPGNDRHGPILQTLSSRSHAVTSRTCSGALPLVNAVRSVTFVCRPSGLVSAALRARAQPARHCRKLRSGVQRRDGAPNGVLALSFRAAKDMTGMNAAPRPLPHHSSKPRCPASEIPPR